MGAEKLSVSHCYGDQAISLQQLSTRLSENEYNVHRCAAAGWWGLVGGSLSWLGWFCDMSVGAHSFLSRGAIRSQEDHWDHGKNHR